MDSIKICRTDIKRKFHSNNGYSNGLETLKEKFNTLSNHGNANQKYYEIHLTPVRITKNKSTIDS